MEFITLELTKKLKEKGFEYKRVSLYDKHKCVDTNYATPTIAQALKWLRAEKSLYVVPCVMEYYDTDADGNIINKFVFWSFDIALTENGDIIYSENERIDDRRFNSYEDAALAGIDYVLDNLI